MKADLKRTALHQMLRPHSKKMFKVGSALNIADLEAVPHNGSKDRYPLLDFDGLCLTLPQEFN